jgi:hypothetical protein
MNVRFREVPHLAVAGHKATFAWALLPPSR